MDGDGTELIMQSLAVAGIAMCWGVNHSSEAVYLFDLSKSSHFEHDEFSDLLTSEGNYAGWLHMAEELISRYEGVGGFVDYQGLPAN